MNHIYGDDGHLRIEAIETMIDGELTAREESMLEKHLEVCADCQEWRNRLMMEQRFYVHAGRALASEPPPIWAGISARLVEKDQRRRWWSEWVPPRLAARRQGLILAAATALSIVLVAGLALSPSRLVPRVDQAPFTTDRAKPPEIRPDRPAVGVTRPWLRQSSGGRRRRATIELAEKAELMRQLQRTEIEYQKTIRLLERAIARRPDTLAPETWEEYRVGMARIDQAIATSRAALLRNPSDATAGRFVISAYAKKVELLQYIALR